MTSVSFLLNFLRHLLLDGLLRLPVPLLDAAGRRGRLRPPGRVGRLPVGVLLLAGQGRLQHGLAHVHLHPAEEVQGAVPGQAGGGAHQPAAGEHEVHGALQTQVHRQTGQTKAEGGQEGRGVLPSAVERQRPLHQAGADQAGRLDAEFSFLVSRVGFEWNFLFLIHR